MMRQRVPLVLSATALAVALLGSTPLGHAAGGVVQKVVPRAAFAENAGKLNGRKSSTSPTAGQIPVVGSNGKLPASIVAVTSTGPKGDPGVSGYEQVVKPLTLVDAGSNNYDVPCPGDKVVIAGGWDTTKTAGAAIVSGSQPKSRSVWTFRVSTPTAGSKDVSLYVICANATG